MRGLHELALFAGAGGGILGGHLLGWRTVCAVEIEKYPRWVLLARQRDGILPLFPIWDDITTFDGKPWKGRVDIVSGGFPCQDISAAGKGAGIEGERSGLWGEMARVIDEVRPRFAFVENSPMLTSRGLGRVLGDLAEMGYNARWCVLGADDAGAPHRRKRIWILAYSESFRDRRNTGELQEADEFKKTERQEGRVWQFDNAGKSNLAYPGCKYAVQGNTAGMDTEKEERAYSSVYNKSGSKGQADMADPNEQRLQRSDVREAEHKTEKRLPAECGKVTWWDTDPAAEHKPELGRVASRLAHHVDRLKAIGNGQVSAVAGIAFTILSEGLI